jgi:hypothetical protein
VNGNLPENPRLMAHRELPEAAHLQRETIRLQIVQQRRALRAQASSPNPQLSHRPFLLLPPAVALDTNEES